MDSELLRPEHEVSAVVGKSGVETDRHSWCVLAIVSLTGMGGRSAHLVCFHYSVVGLLCSLIIMACVGVCVCWGGGVYVCVISMADVC